MRSGAHKTECRAMRRVLLMVTCLLPGPLIWLGLAHLGEAKYPVVSPATYWEARLSGRPEFFRLDGYAWFAPPWIPIHGYWPLRVSVQTLADTLVPEAEAHVTRLLEADRLRDSAPEHFRGLTGEDFGTDWEAWRQWWASRSGSLDRERILAYLNSLPPLDDDLRDLFEADALGRSRRLLLEVLFFWALWCILVIGVFGLRVFTPSTRLARQRLCPALKGLVVATFFGVVAFAPYVPLGYGASAFSTGRGPGFMAYSGPYMWRGGIHYGGTIGYRTFLEILGTPALWLLHKMPWLGEVSFVPPLVVTSILLYALVGFALGLVVGAIRAPAGVYYKGHSAEPV